MQRISILLCSWAFALAVLVVGLILSRTSVAAALTVMGVCAFAAIGVIVLIVREARRPKPTLRAARDTRGNDISQPRKATP